jgi:hypothetical protein
VKTHTFYSISIFVLLFIFCIESFAFQNSPLFSTEKPLEMELVTTLSQLRQSESDTIFFSAKMRYKNEAGSWDSLEVELRARGNTRRSMCYFPPLRVKIKKKKSKDSLFEEDKSLKLVLPCQLANSFNGMIVREYMCYKFYENITPYHFQTRMLNLTLVDQNDKKSKTHNMVAFFIEDDDKVAKRFQLKISNAKPIIPGTIHDSTAVRQDFFAFMIGNTDWSNTGQHNVKMMVDKNKINFPLPYDFDMAGIVGAPYAIPYDYLPIKTVQERLYRGLCRDPGLIQYIRNQYMTAEPHMMEIVDQYEAQLSAPDFKRAKKYLSDFFDILKNEKLFNQEILSKCQPYNFPQTN